MRDAAIDTPRPSPRSATGRRSTNPSGPALTSAAVAAQRLGGGRTRAVAGSRPSGGGGRSRELRDDPDALSQIKDRLAPLVSLKSLGAAAFSLVLMGIVANAVWFQRGRHPAPLFATGQQVPETVWPASPPLPQPRPQPVAEAEPAAPESGPAATPAAEAPVEAAPALPVKTVSTKAVASKPHHDDGIARLLLGQPLASDKSSMAGGADTAADKKTDSALLATQRQLVKLGYPVKPDGRMSIATRGAIEAFERQQHMHAENDAITPTLKRKIAAAVAANTVKAQ